MKTYDNSDQAMTKKKDSVTATLVKCQRLNVRNLAEKDAQVIGVLNPSDHIKVDATYEDPVWAKVRSPYYGFAMKEYLSYTV